MNKFYLPPFGEVKGQHSFYFEHLFAANNGESYLHTISNNVFYKVFFLRAGSGYHQIGQNLYTITPYSIHIVQKGISHSLDKAVLVTGYALFISDGLFLRHLPENFTKALSFGGILSNKPIMQLNKKEFQMIESLIGSLNEFPSSLYGVVDIDPDYLNILFSYAFLRFSRNIGSDIIVSNGIKNKNVKTYIQLVGQHFKKHYKVKYYADILCVAPNYLNELCKKETGKTAFRIIKDTLIAEAKLMLMHSNKTIKEVSYELGFCSPSHFTHFFRQDTGITPEIFKN